ncbi:hypothetical protein R1flu_024128 [Riccia fluitans]|uniref:DUF3700 domain-containing protein n=1 Tax=Riccia fluitans TaxID=41844 RepID=A0ABD1XWX5_9MARC
MLALFNGKVASPPKEITVQGDDSRKHDREIVDGFKAQFPGAVAVEIDGKCTMSYSHANQQLLRPRYMSVQDDIMCMFEGVIENMPVVRQQYGITRSITEVSLIIEIYRVLRDRSPYPADHVIRGLTGAFAFVLYDNTTSSVFVAVDCHGKVPFYWGGSADGSLVFSEDQKLVKTACGKSFSPFPQGCYFSSADGLQSFEHPLSPIKAMPRVDSQGQVCGSTFKVMRCSIVDRWAYFGSNRVGCELRYQDCDVFLVRFPEECLMPCPFLQERGSDDEAVFRVCFDNVVL